MVDLLMCRRQPGIGMFPFKSLMSADDQQSDECVRNAMESGKSQLHAPLRSEGKADNLAQYAIHTSAQ
jgi:hypothetical protein